MDRRRLCDRGVGRIARGSAAADEAQARRAAAVGSLIAVVVQFGGVLLVPAIREVTPDSAYTSDHHLPVCYGIYMLSRLSTETGWLR